MGDLSQLGGGGRANYINSLGLFFSTAPIVTTEDGAVWLKTGVVETDIASYPDATISKYVKTFEYNLVLSNLKMAVRLDGMIWGVLSSSMNIIREYDAITLVATGRTINTTYGITRLGCSQEGQATGYIAALISATNDPVKTYDTVTLSEVDSYNYPNRAGAASLIAVDSNSTKAWFTYSGKMFLDGVEYYGHPTSDISFFYEEGGKMYIASREQGTSGQLNRYRLQAFSIDRANRIFILEETYSLPSARTSVGNSNYLYQHEFTTTSTVSEVIDVVGFAVNQRLYNTDNGYGAIATAHEGLNYYVRIK
ncbi:hypothetical protein [Shewanella psychrotolerans]|uniref:hypothetical protein n=1 Tax=Shewanella psychrotolerans TaxID=2864206 RepID=UPI001C65E795|nr:hypothetical protein [Shewanella psychrotolerans]QYK02453.1 hypothetical protein K0I62_05745 [Shewanella psychrotolerans]